MQIYPIKHKRCIRFIDQFGKREEFIRLFEMSPEEYLDKFRKDVNVTLKILDFLEIDAPGHREVKYA